MHAKQIKDFYSFPSTRYSLKSQVCVSLILTTNILGKIGFQRHVYMGFKRQKRIDGIEQSRIIYNLGQNLNI